MKRVGGYWIMLPQQNQVRKALWTQVDAHTGLNRIDAAIPKEIIQDRLENEMFIRLVNGSTIQFIGSDAWPNLVGSSPAGLVWSEWATSDPNSWVYLQPILVENNGWALFQGTPEGNNHMADMYEKRRDDPDWHVELLTAYETKHLTQGQLDEAKLELIDLYGEDVGTGYYNGQYLCSFNSAKVGSYYGTEIEKLHQNGQITDVAYDRKYPVHTAWDIGGTTAIIFFQIVGPKIHVIDYLESTQMSADYYVRQVQAKPYVYGHHVFPADLEEQDDWTNPRSRILTLHQLGIKPRVLPKQKSVNDGINAVIQILPTCWFDKTRCKRLVQCLQQYHRRYDEKRQVFEDKAYKDQYAHGCLLGDSLIKTMRGDLPIRDVQIGDFVWTPNGWAKVLAAGPTQSTDDLLRIDCTNGSELICTPNHKIMTQRGFVEVDALRYSDYIFSGREWQCKIVSLFSTGLSTSFRETITANGTTHNPARAIFIGRFGSIITAQFQKAMKFITKRASTTKFPTWNVYPCLNTSGTMPWNELRRVNSNLLPKKHWLRPQSGTGLRKVENGTGNTAKTPGKAKRGINAFARIAARTFIRLILIAPSSATRIVSKKPYVSDGGKQLVYDLTVESQGCYQANGLLVSNSDAMRYLAVSGVRNQVKKDLPRPRMAIV